MSNEHPSGFNPPESSRDREATVTEISDRYKTGEYTDNEGIQRDIYEFTNQQGHKVSVVFYSPNELPFSEEVVKNKRAFIYGQPPQHRTPTEWEKFILQTGLSSEPNTSPINPLQFQRQEAIESGNSLFFVESSVTGLLDMAFTLGYEDPTARVVRQRFAQKQYIPEVGAVLDSVIALKMKDSDQGLEDQKSNKAEAVFLASLLGDEAAQSVKTKQVADYTAHAQEWHRQNIATVLQDKEDLTQAGYTESLQLPELVAIHMTSYKPKRGPDGLLRISTTFNETDWRVPRGSIHFSLNHPVMPVFDRKRVDTGYAVIAPLDPMVKARAPTVLNTVDTFFECNPGEQLTMPSNTWLVEGGDIESGKLYESTENNTVVYQNKLRPNHIQQLSTELANYDRFYLNQSLTETITRGRYYDMPAGSTTDGLITRTELAALVGSFGDNDNREDILVQLGDMTVSEYISQKFNSLDFQAKIPPETIKVIASELEQQLVAKTAEYAILSKTKELGYQTHTGGMQSWDLDSDDAVIQTIMLAAELGIETGAHETHVSRKLEVYFGDGSDPEIGWTNELQSGRINSKEYRTRAHKLIHNNFTQMSPQSRRMMYVAGAY